MTKFGWDLPPGVTMSMIDPPATPCECCGEGDCDCPECPKCGEAGNPYCYEQGHLTYTIEQRIGRAQLKVARLEEELYEAKSLAQDLEEEKRIADREAKGPLEYEGEYENDH